MHVISTTYLDVQVARASAALPAASAWDATPLEIFCSQFNYVTLNLTYTAGAVGGAFEWRIDASPYSVAALVPAGAEEWLRQSLYAAAGVVAGVDATSLVQREDQSYTAIGVAAEAFPLGPLNLAGAFERLRVAAREVGVPGTPGTLQIQAFFSM